jgi:type I restriction enzyme S subunit
MQSNYKPIGDYIFLVDERNKELKVTKLLGLSISKEFIPSVANTVGTDMRNYKIIRKNQFACSTMQVRRDRKMPVALLTDFDEAIISQAYSIFEIHDKNQLMPEYLMMWFSRAEFDRHAEFLAVGGVRGTLEWEDFLAMELPVPSIEKQQEIVKEYNVVKNRIALNEELNRNLEETAQALYKHWFVDFEFPVSKESHPKLVSGSQPLGYKSAGGKMVFNEELDKEIPVGWELCSIIDFCSEMKSGGTPSRPENNYWNKPEIPWLKTGELCNSVLIDAEEYISLEGLRNSSAKLLPKNTVLVAMYGQGNTKGKVGYLKIEASTNQACCAMICKNEAQASFLYYHLRVNQQEIVSAAIGGAQPNLSKEIIENVPVLRPELKLFDNHPFVQILSLKESITREIKALYKLQTLIFSKMATVESEKNEPILKN